MLRVQRVRNQAPAAFVFDCAPRTIRRFCAPTVIAGSETSYVWSRWIYLRTLGVLYAAAFLSLAPQIVGLIGPHGVFPSTEQLAVTRNAAARPERRSRI